jgi:hypothetical protein
MSAAVTTRSSDATHVTSFTNDAGVLDFYLGDHAPLFPGNG